MFGFRSSGFVATGFQYDDMPAEQRIAVGDLVSLGPCHYEVISVEPKPNTPFGSGLIEIRAERIA